MHAPSPEVFIFPVLATSRLKGFLYVGLVLCIHVPVTLSFVIAIEARRSPEYPDIFSNYSNVIPSEAPQGRGGILAASLKP